MRAFLQPLCRAARVPLCVSAMGCNVAVPCTVLPGLSFTSSSRLRVARLPAFTGPAFRGEVVGRDGCVFGGPCARRGLLYE